MRRYVITGAPGAGKTTILTALRDRGYAVVGEAATDVITREQRLGRDLPHTEAGFLDAIARLQRRRQQLPVPPAATVQVFDRSPICTVALARYLGLDVPPALHREVDRIVSERIYQPRVFFVRLLGFVTPTAARRITLDQSVRFEGFHERAYREYGFELIEVPPGPLAERVDLVDRHLHEKVTHSGRW
jgi:predicted ATPase